MTECERLIKEKFLPEDFFNEEIICDFIVTEKLKKIWAIEIDMLVKFDKVCRRHNLHYMLAGGSLLGLVRHNGFIPWDDDIDVYMPRKDYNKLCTEFRNEFSEPYSFMLPCENGFLFSHAMIRNSKTSAIVQGFMYEEFNQGIFIDIFPIDNCLPEKAEENWQRINYLVMTNSTNMRRSLKYPTKRDLERIEKYPYMDGEKVFEEIEKIATMYNNIDCEYATTATITPYPAQRQIFKWKDILETKDVNYYGYKIKAPCNYDAILTTEYGDYMKMPPKDQRGVWHSFSIFDPDVDYKTKLLTLRKEDEKKHSSGKL